MFDFSKFDYDFHTGRFVVEGEQMIFHCHHYNCFLQRSIQDAEYIDSAPILVGAAVEVVLAQSARLLSRTPDVAARKSTVETLYRLCGFGLIDLSAVTAEGGEVRTRSTHYSTGWKEKFGRSRTPVAFFSTGFLAAALAAIYSLDPASIQARQTACRSTGADEDVFLLSRGSANFALFEPRRDTVLAAVGNDPEPDTSVNREGITRAVAGLPLLGNAEGLITPVSGCSRDPHYAELQPHQLRLRARDGGGCRVRGRRGRCGPFHRSRPRMRLQYDGRHHDLPGMGCPGATDAENARGLAIRHRRLHQRVGGASGRCWTSPLMRPPSASITTTSRELPPHVRNCRPRHLLPRDRRGGRR